MEKEVGKRNLLVLITGAILILLTYLFIQAFWVSDGENTSSDITVQEPQESVNEDLFLNTYFEDKFNETPATESTANTESNTCELNGQIIQEGTVLFDTTCVVNQPEKSNE